MFYTTDHIYFVVLESLDHILAYKVIHFDLSFAEKNFGRFARDVENLFLYDRNQCRNQTIKLKLVKSVVLISCWPGPYMAGQFLLLSLAELAADMILLVAFLILGVKTNFGGSFWSTSSDHRNKIEMV